MDTDRLSARLQAAAILKAWGSNNLAVLHSNLISAEVTPSPGADTGEGERLEILAAIASNMRALLESDQLGGVAKYLPLLRHLATPPPTARGYAYYC